MRYYYSEERMIKTMVNRTDKGYYHFQEGEEKKITLSAGNSKILGLCFSNKPGKEGSCIRDCKKCYAKKAYVNNAPQPKECRRRNFEATKEDNFANRMNLMVKIALKDLSPRYIRINDSGDFTSLQNFIDWRTVAKKNPDAKFLAYTKRIDILNIYTEKYSGFKYTPLANFTLAISIMPDMSEDEMLESIFIARTIDVPIAFVGDYSEYPPSVEHYLRHKFLVDCTYDNCAQCDRICWDYNIMTNNHVIQFHWH